MIFVLACYFNFSSNEDWMQKFNEVCERSSSRSTDAGVARDHRQAIDGDLGLQVMAVELVEASMVEEAVEGGCLLQHDGGESCFCST